MKIISIHILLTVILVVGSVFVTSSSCEIFQDSPRFNRIALVIANAWRNCQDRLKYYCERNSRQYCDLQLHELTYEEWEKLKPSAGCTVSEEVLPTLCKVLYNETCYSGNNGGQSKAKLWLLFASVICNFL